MRLSSPALDDGTFPVRYARDGEGVSPPVRWSGLPEGAEEVVVLRAVDAPLDLEPGTDARKVLEEAQRHEVDRAELTVSYERPRP